MLKLLVLADVVSAPSWGDPPLRGSTVVEPGGLQQRASHKAQLIMVIWCLHRAGRSSTGEAASWNLVACSRQPDVHEPVADDNSPALCHQLAVQRAQPALMCWAPPGQQP